MVLYVVAMLFLKLKMFAVHVLHLKMSKIEGKKKKIHINVKTIAKKFN